MPSRRYTTQLPVYAYWALACCDLIAVIWTAQPFVHVLLVRSLSRPVWGGLTTCLHSTVSSVHSIFHTVRDFFLLFCLLYLPLARLYNFIFAVSTSLTLPPLPPPVSLYTKTWELPPFYKVRTCLVSVFRLQPHTLPDTAVCCCCAMRNLTYQVVKMSILSIN
jgi:hypothetical protein